MSTNQKWSFALNLLICFKKRIVNFDNWGNWPLKQIFFPKIVKIKGIIPKFHFFLKKQSEIAAVKKTQKNNNKKQNKKQKNNKKQNKKTTAENKTKKKEKQQKIKQKTTKNNKKQNKKQKKQTNKQTKNKSICTFSENTQCSVGAFL